MTKPTGLPRRRGVTLPVLYDDPNEDREVTMPVLRLTAETRQAVEQIELLLISLALMPAHPPRPWKVHQSRFRQRCRHR